jgi:endosialidase-like protein
MKNKISITLVTWATLLLLSTLNLQLPAFAQGTAFTYQGRLTDGTNPADGNYDLRFILYNAALGGSQTGPVLTNLNVEATNGLFLAPVDFGAGIFNGTAYWLEIGVRTNGSSSDFTTLSPRQPLTASPYASHAANAANLMSFVNAPLDIKVNGQRALRLEATGGAVNVIGGASVNGVAPGVIGATIGGGGTSSSGLEATNRVEANYGTIGGGAANTIQTLSRNSTVSGGWRNTIHADSGWSTIGGGESNSIEPNARYSTISGGGLNKAGGFGSAIGGGSLNTVQTNAEHSAIGGGLRNLIASNAMYATIGGGTLNTNSGTQAFIGAGFQNVARGDRAVIGGGYQNVATNSETTVGGGVNNVAGGWNATIGGGALNVASGDYSFVGAGLQNQAITNYATVPGGQGNRAAGRYSLAAGRGARADHDGAFVWADSALVGLASTTTNQFSVRADGGVRFVTAGAGATIDGIPVLTGSTGPGSGLNADLLDGLNSTAFSLVGHTHSGTDITSGTIAEPVIDGAIARDSEIMPILLSNDGAGSGVDADRVDGLEASAFWRLGGNLGTVGDTQFLGTSENQSLELIVNGTRALRLEPNTNGAPNLIGGAARNYVGIGVTGATISGGGDPVNTNRVSANFGAVGGGRLNVVESGASNGTIGGGQGNEVRAQNATVGGGQVNVIEASAPGSGIAGGNQNRIGTFSANASIGGGDRNRIEAFATAATIGGGSQSVIQLNAFYATIGGGRSNDVGAIHAVIAGGLNNRIQTNADMSAIGGGRYHTIRTNAEFSTISGGSENTIEEFAIESTVGGGNLNVIHRNSGAATISGGVLNAVGTNAPWATIGGGFNHVIEADADASTVGGGFHNAIGAGAQYAMIPGGRDNVASGDYSLAAGRRAQANHTGAFVWSDSSNFDFPSTANNQFNVRAIGGVRIVTGIDGSGNPTAGVSLLANDTSWNVISDRNLKKNFRPADGREILDKLAQVPIQRWNYEWESDEAVPHLGPTAQDFKHAFYPGRDDKSISTQEMDGVALAAIQGLLQLVNQQETEIRALKTKAAEVDTLNRRFAELETRIQQLNTR